MEQDNQVQRNMARMKAVREAYWVGTDLDDSEFDNLHDALTLNEIVDEPSIAQIKALFMMLPDSVVGKGISWGFDDTEVGELIHEFVAENRDAVAKQVSG